MDKKTPPNLNLKFLGQVNHSKTLDYIRNANICVFASSAENFPNVLLEYMSYGSICLCSNKQPMKSLLGNAGLFFDLDVENDLQNKLKLILNNIAIQKNENIITKKSLKFSWSKQQKKL